MDLFRVHLRTLAVLLLAAFLIMDSTGCRKGEGDPLISPYPRKMRLVREWQFSEYFQRYAADYEFMSNGNQTFSRVDYEAEVDGDDFRMDQLEQATDVITTEANGEAWYTMTFNGDGTFTRIEQRNEIDFFNVRVVQGIPY